MTVPAAPVMPACIATGRLLLRPFRNDDLHSMHAHYSDPECTRYTFRRALSESESWYAMANMAGHWLLRGYGPYAVEEKASGDVLGTVGLWYPQDWPGPEIKWALTRRYWGKGYATEAARAVHATAAAHLPALRLISFIHSDNAGSIAVARALGAEFEEAREFRGGLWHIYRHRPPESAAAA